MRGLYFVEPKIWSNPIESKAFTCSKLNPASLTNYFNSINYYSIPVIIVGDFNVDILKTSSSTKKIIDFFNSYNLTILNKQATRVRINSKTLIDFLIVNDISKKFVKHINTDSVSFSDHSAIIVGYDNSKLKCHKSVTEQHSFRKITDTNVREFVDHLSSSNFSDLLAHNNTSDNFLFLVNQSISSYFPLVTITRKCHSMSALNWHTNKIVKLSDEAKHSKSNAILSGNFNDMSAYRQMRNILNKEIMASKKSFICSLLLSNRHDPKKMWSVLNPIIKNEAHDSKPSKLIYNNQILTLDCEIANCFSLYFSESVSLIAETFDTSVFPTFNPVYDECPQFNFHETNFPSVAKLLSSLSKKGPGVNGVPYKFIQLWPSFFCYFISSYINSSFDTNVYPASFKVAKVKPVYKKDDKTIVSNYRPVSVLPNISKLFERTAHCQIVNFLNTNKLLIYEQHGFRAHHSTTTALTSLLDKIYVSVDNGFVVCCIFLDFSKAFDTINHFILLEKLKYCFNFSEAAVSWIKSYLSGRSFFVEVGDSNSNFFDLSCGVPQGSILGPLLFIMYINDIIKCLKHSDAVIYADDTSIVFKANSLSMLEEIVNHDLRNISDYCSKNRLKLNPSKCSAMIFGKYCDVSTLNFMLDNSRIEIVDKVKYLGFTVDNQLNFNEHLLNLSKKIKSCNAALLRFSRFMPRYYLRLIFNAIGMSHINFSSIIISNFSKKYFKMLEKYYYTAGAIVLNTYRYLLPNSNWFDFLQTLYLKRFVFIFNIISTDNVMSLKTSFIRRNVNYNLRNKNTYQIVRFNKTSSSKAFYIWGPRYWFLLPTHIKNSTNVNTFSNLCLDWIKKIAIFYICTNHF